MRSDVLRAAIESELDDHKQKLIRLRGKLQKAVDDLDVSRSNMLATMLGCYHIRSSTALASTWIKTENVSWFLRLHVYVYHFWSVRLPYTKVDALPALAKTADSEEADFRDFLTRVNLKWRDQSNTRKSWQFLWCGTCCVAWLLFFQSDGSEVLDQGSLQGKKHIIQVMKVFYSLFSMYACKQFINTNKRYNCFRYPWKLSWPLHSGWCSREHSWDTQLLCLRIFLDGETLFWQRWFILSKHVGILLPDHLPGILAISWNNSSACWPIRWKTVAYLGIICHACACMQGRVLNWIVS